MVGVSGVVMRAVSLMECCLGEVTGSMKKVVVVKMVVGMVESMVVILVVILVELIV